MGRYLIFLKYIGTNYKGVTVNEDVKTVGGVVQKAVNSFNLRNKTKVKTSSRTDKGVHAFCNTVQVDLVRRCGEDLDLGISQRLNRLLRLDEQEVRVLDVKQVNSNFNCRHNAIGRSYMYRVAVTNQHISPKLIPLLEKDRCLFTNRLNFNEAVFFKAAEILSGSHYFTAFTTQSYLKQHNENVYKYKRCMEIGVRRGQLNCSQSEEEYLADVYQVYEIHFKSTSFVYKQIRIMVGLMLYIADGEMDVEELKVILSRPKSILPDNVLHPQAACGLYLKQVHYKPSDLVYVSEKEVEYELFIDEMYDSYFNQLYGDDPGHCCLPGESIQGEATVFE